MKKVIVAFVAVAMAIAANAATFCWSSTGTIYQPTASKTAVSGFTAYLLSVDTVTQSALVTALRGGGSITDYTALSTYTTPTAAKITTTDFTAEGTQTAYFAIVQDGYVYISKVSSKGALALGKASLAYANQSAPSAIVNSFETSFADPGWYSITAVPEPTSGLLLLLGMAGLALKRKVA